MKLGDRAFPKSGEKKRENLKADNMVAERQTKISREVPDG
jgi:hypothetical protein